MFRRFVLIRTVYLLTILLALSACSSVPPEDSWGGSARWPDSGELRDALIAASTDPATWIPTAGAGVLLVTGMDDEVTEWAMENKPLFGEDAQEDSSQLRDLSIALYYLTALTAPSASAGDKVRGLAVGVGSRWTAEAMAEGLKSLSGRERPDGSSDRSFPSGHATTAASNAALVSRNVEYMNVPRWAAHGMKAGAWGIAGATAWARVEAGKHHVSDVLAGLALGNFVAAFMQQAFLGPSPGRWAVGFVPVEKGGLFTLSLSADP